MRILTVEDVSYNIDDIPELIDDLQYGVLDYSSKHVDYYFVPLVFLESFHAPAAVLQIGKHTVNIPLDWSVVICDAEVGNPEVMSLMSLNDRGFTAFTYNPISGFSPKYLDISITNVYNDVKWYAPKLKQGHLLVVPLEEGDNPACALFVKDTAKIPEVLDIEEIW